MEGKGYRLAEQEWVGIVPVYMEPIRYCEIGAFCGHNVVSFAKNFVKNEKSKLYCIDPWLSYADCPDSHYGNHHENYMAFHKNVIQFGLTDMVEERRGFSSEEMLKFEDNFFDIIFVDGNHQEPYYEQDFELSKLKLKSGGILIVDDTQHPPIAAKAVEIFENKYKGLFEVLAKKEGQYFYRKV